MFQQICPNMKLFCELSSPLSLKWKQVKGPHDGGIPVTDTFLQKIRYGSFLNSVWQIIPPNNK